MRYLLDTNIVSDLIRNPQGKVTARIARIGEEMVCTSIIVAAELRYGAAKKGSARLTAQLESVFQGLEILPLEVPAEIAYADLRSRLEAAGKPIGGNDMLIAAHAISLGHTIVTDNEREFSRIDGLALENWLRRD
jgi:tRNA(fMet)-specific endonuclease VapC